MLELVNVTKEYRARGAPVTAVDGVSLSVDPGEFVAVMGPSGSGKSSLLQIIGVLDTPSRGKYLFDGQDVSTLGDRALSAIRNARLGYVFQSFNLFPHLTAIENVEAPLAYARVDPRSRRRRALEVLERLDLGRRALHYPAQLSGGEQQRVAIARALVGRPSVLLADEPTGSLSRSGGQVVSDILTSLNQEGLTVVLATHDIELGRRAGRVIEMIDGKIPG